MTPRKVTAAVEPKVPPPEVRVEIHSGGHVVVIVAPVSLGLAERTALKLFHATNSSNITKGTDVMGFHTDLPPQPTFLPIPDEPE